MYGFHVLRSRIFICYKQKGKTFEFPTCGTTLGNLWIQYVASWVREMEISSACFSHFSWKWKLFPLRLTNTKWWMMGHWPFYCVFHITWKLLYRCSNISMHGKYFLPFTYNRYCMLWNIWPVFLYTIPSWTVQVFGITNILGRTYRASVIEFWFNCKYIVGKITCISYAVHTHIGHCGWYLRNRLYILTSSYMFFFHLQSDLWGYRYLSLLCDGPLAINSNHFAVAMWLLNRKGAFYRSLNKSACRESLGRTFYKYNYNTQHEVCQWNMRMQHHRGVWGLLQMYFSYQLHSVKDKNR